MADQVPTYPSPRAGAPVYHNGDASGGATDVVPQLHGLADEGTPGFNIDPNLQPHAPNHAQQLAQGAMDLQPDYGHSVQSAAESAAQQAAANAALARSKTSRACDECRRKKIRCDGSGEMEMGACSACKRSGHACAYSRTPQKRGPNRGYIRELTQRVETLERERKGPREDGSPASPAPIPSSDVAFFGLSGGLPDLQGSPSGFQGPLSGYPQTGIKRVLSLGADEGASRTGVPPEARSLVMQPSLLDSYYAYLHPFLPFMLSDSEDLNQLISQGHTASARAFIQAFELSMNAAQYTGQHATNVQQFSRHVYDIYNNCKWEDDPNILQLYTALLLVVESINRGTTTYLSRAGQDPWTYFRELFSVAIASNVFYEAMQASTQDEHGYRRLALCMSVLDTFLAFANRKEGFATIGVDWATYTRPEDQQAYGRRLFEMNRITRVIRKLQDVQIQEANSSAMEPDAQAPHVSGAKPVIKLGPQDTALIATLKSNQTELLQSIQLTCNYNDDPIIGMSVWYARILIELHYWPLTAASALLYSLRRLVETFQHLGSTNLWSSHFAGLAAHTLFQLCDFADTKDEAVPLLDMLCDHLNMIVTGVDTESFDAGIRSAVERKRQSLRSANLERLAAVAVGKGDGTNAEGAAAEAAAKAAAAVALAGGNSTFSGANMSREGYITALLA